MHELLFFSLNWHPLLWVLAVVACFVIIALVARVGGLLLLGLVLYFGAAWSAWEWVPLMFWIVWLIALALFGWALVSVTDRRVQAGLAAATAAAVVATILAVSPIFGWVQSVGAAAIKALDRGSATVVVDTGTEEQNLPDELINSLTVTTVPYVCQSDDNGLVAWEIQSLRADRDRSDYVGPALPSEGSMDEVYRRICVDPSFGGMVGDYFANLQFKNVRIADLNPWLTKWQGDVHADAATAASYVLLLDVSRPTDAQVLVAADKNREWQQEASRLITLLQKFKEIGVEADQSVFNYHLLGGGLVSGGLPVIGLNDVQENLPAYQLVLDSKTDDCVVKIGFNMADSRLEAFSCDQPKPATTTPPVRTTTTTTRPPTSTTTTRPPTSTTTTRPPTTTTTTSTPKVSHPSPTGQATSPSRTSEPAQPSPSHSSETLAPSTGSSSPPVDNNSAPTGNPPVVGPGDGEVKDG